MKTNSPNFNGIITPVGITQNQKTGVNAIYRDNIFSIDNFKLVI